MEDVRFRRLVNEITPFLRQESHPLPNLTTSSPLTDRNLCDVALCAFSCLKAVPSRLCLLDRLLRRKCIFEHGSSIYPEAFCRLAVELADLERSFVQDDTSSPVHMCLCMQLMSLCLSRSTQSDKLTAALDDLFISFNSILTRNSFDCMTAGFTLLVNVLRYYTDWNFDEFISDCLQGKTCDINRIDEMPPYFGLVRRILDGDKHDLARVGFLYALTGSLSVERWGPVDPHVDQPTLSCDVLSYAFSHVAKNVASYSALETSVLLFLAKIGQCWSSRNRKWMAVSDKVTTRQRFSDSVKFDQFPLKDLLNFCLEMKNSPLSAIRHCCLDAFEDVLWSHFACCQTCRVQPIEGLCDNVSNLVNQVTGLPWFTRGTVAALQRLVLVLHEGAGFSIIWLLSRLAVTLSNSASLEEQCTVVVSNLMTCVSDPTLYAHVSELYCYIGSKLLVENDQLLSAWLTALIVKAEADYVTYGPCITQYVLPKLALFNLELIDRLIRCVHAADSVCHIPLLLTCYRLNVHLRRQRTKKHDSSLVTSCHESLKIALICCDTQIRMNALDFLRTTIVECKHYAEFIQLLEIFFHFLKFNQWPAERSVRHQISYSIYVVSKRLVELRCRARLASALPSDQAKPPTLTKLGSMHFSGPIQPALSHCTHSLTHMAALLLRCIYPGAPSSRLSFGLSGLYNLALAVTYATTDATSPGNDAGDKDALHLLSRAACWANDVHISESIHSPDWSTVNPAVERSLLTSRLFVGLCSTYEEDREYALQTMLLTRLSEYLTSSCIDRIWSKSLIDLAPSARPDISPIAWHFLRLAICCAQSGFHSSWTKSRVDNFTCTTHQPPRSRALSVVTYLLDVVEQQVSLAETVPVDGLLAVAANKPFYALLSSIRAVIGNDHLLNAPMRKPDNSNLLPVTGANPTPGKHHINRLDVVLEPNDLFDSQGDKNSPVGSSISTRLLHLALRISALILPILAHPSPEGLLPETEKEEMDSFDFLQTPLDLDTDVLSLSANETRKYPEYLIICCWRSVRELSVLLGVSLPRFDAGTYLNYDVPQLNSFPEHASGLSDSQILQISEFFCTQLLCGRHRGAVEQCSIGFRPFCQFLLSSRLTHRKQIPALWLQAVLDDLLLPSDVTRPVLPESTVTGFLERARELPFTCLRCAGEVYCITRRSAGLPLFIQDILSALCNSNCGDLSYVTSTMNRLLDLIDSAVSSSTVSCVNTCGSIQRCVVTFNIARTLFRSSTLMQSTSTFVERAICLALDGLGSHEWIIRNSAGLLYSTLVERIFGVNRSRDMTSRKNCLSSASFFTRYSILKHHLVRIFEMTTTNLAKPGSEQTRLYAALLLMTRLLPPHQTSDSVDVVGPTFWPFVIRCAGSYSIRIRQLSARVIPCLVHANRLPIITRTYIKWLQQLTKVPRVKHSNLIHGLLLQLQQLFALEPWCSEETGSNISSDRSILLQQLATQLSHLADPVRTRPPMIRKSFLCIITSLPPAIQLENLDNCGVDMEASEICIRLAISSHVNTLRLRMDSGRCDAALSLSQLLQKFTSTECRMVALRQAILALIADPNELSLTHLYDESLENCNAIIDSSRSLSVKFLRLVSDWVGCVHLVHLAQHLSTSVRLEAYIVRYTVILITILTPSIPSDSPLWNSVKAWIHSNLAALNPENLATGVHLPAMVRLLSFVSEWECSEKIEILEQFIRFSQLGTDNTTELKTSLMYAIGEIYRSRIDSTMGISNTLLEFMLGCLLNFGHPELQESACKSCHFLLTQSHSDNSASPPLPYVLFPKLLRHLTSSGSVSPATLFVMIKNHLFGLGEIDRLDKAQPNPELRVFAHSDPHNVRDLTATLTCAIQALSQPCEDSGSEHAVLHVEFVKVTQLLTDLQLSLLCNFDLVLRPSQVREQFAADYLNAFHVENATS
ncbi:hypothetical protein EG68_02848 [Paragonimus skrjabini miyazakii]|uniref:DUF2428 domain-containing protein n=1 Tax=Paragonimus skrjabini miyazakii TaxID=59628 RepID=A0A8S9YW27_9TREM|nr:hypothetical protein EG68_02848 [Paragonimus skrjabini miyazakii]